MLSRTEAIGILIGVFSPVLSFTQSIVVNDIGPVPMILSSFENPASLDGNGRQLSANIFSLSTNISSTGGNFSVAEIFEKNSDFLRKNVFNSSGFSSGTGIVDVKGPSFAIQFKDRLTLGLVTRARAISNFQEVDSRLISEVGEVQKVEHLYPYILAANSLMRINTTVFSDLGLVTSYKVYRSKNHALNIGTNLKVYNGIANSSVSAADLTGTIKINRDGVSYLTSSTGEISTVTSGKFLNNPNLPKFLKPGILSFGGDVGAVYTYTSSQCEFYTFKIGVSITDVGILRFRSDSAYSKSYIIKIPEGSGLYFNNNFRNSSFSQTSEVFDRYPNLFSHTSSFNSIYHISPPTMVRIHADYRLSQQISVNTNLYLRLRSSKKTSTDDLNQFCLTPRWIINYFQFALPLSYQNFGGMGIGASLRYKGFVVGSRSLLTTLIKSKQIDAYFGLTFSP